jgi:hypothetical protein
MLVKLALVIFMIFSSHASMATNREGGLDGGRQIDGTRDFEKETKLQRDFLGRKVSISPNSKIESGSLFLDIAPGSTVILNVRQKDKGIQTTRTPFYRNVELPN